MRWDHIPRPDSWLRWRRVEEGPGPQELTGYEVEEFALAPEIVPSILRLDPNSPEDHLLFFKDFGPIAGHNVVGELDPLDQRRRQRGRFSFDLGGLAEDDPRITDPFGLTEVVREVAHGSESFDAWRENVLMVQQAFALRQVIALPLFSRIELGRWWPEGVHAPPTSQSRVVAWFDQMVSEAITSLRFQLDQGVLHTEAMDDLAKVAVLEIYNTILMERPYRICRNETCGKTFSIQANPNTKTKTKRHRTDTSGGRQLQFCSISCRTAQLNRESRRRKRDQAKGAK